MASTMQKLSVILLIIFSAAVLSAQTYSPESHLMIYDNLVKGDSVYEYGAPKLIGGLDSLEMKIVPPFSVLLRNDTGKVLVKVLVDTMGKASNAVVTKGLSINMNREAERVVMSSRFIPSIENNQKFRSYFIVPVEFKKNFPVVTYIKSNCEKVSNLLESVDFVPVDSMPKMLTNTDSIKAWTKFPVEAIKHKIEGKVYIKLLVDLTGIPLCEKVIKGLSYGCNEEALRVAKMIRFSPAIQKKRKIRVYVVVPIEFKLKK